MAKEILLIMSKDVVLTIDKESVTEKIDGYMRVVKRTPKTGGAEFIRAHRYDGVYWDWQAPIKDWSEQVSEEPDLDPRWKRSL